MNNDEAKKFIYGKMLELTCKLELELPEKVRKRAIEELAFLKYANALCEKEKTEEGA